MSMEENPSAVADTQASLYSWYVVSILAVFYMFSFVDRLILAVLVVPMKMDLGLTDVQLSYLGGLSFVIFYTLFGLPMGRVADTYSREWSLDWTLTRR